MKKVLALFCVFVLCSAFQCDDEKLEGQFLTDEMACNAAALDTAQALFNFENASTNNYNIVCNDYKEALNSQILICGDEDGVLQAMVDGLDNCSLLETSECQQAMAEKNTAKENYFNAAPEDFESTCEIYRDAIESVIDNCGETPALTAERDNLGTCPPITGNFVKFVSQDIVYLFNNLQISQMGDMVTVTGISVNGIFSLNLQYTRNIMMDVVTNFELITTDFNYQKDTTINEPFYTNVISVNDDMSFMATFEGNFTNPVSESELLTSGGEINITY